MDSYNREWKQVIFGERQVEDSEGYKYKYVPKDALINEENISPQQKKNANMAANSSGGKLRAGSKDYPNQYVYLKKTPK